VRKKLMAGIKKFMGDRPNSGGLDPATQGTASPSAAAPPEPAQRSSAAVSAEAGK
jgi:hypothetical protein